MKKSRFSEEQILAVLKEHLGRAGTTAVNSGFKPPGRGLVR